MIASPLKTIDRAVVDEELADIMAVYDIETIVIGHPLRTNGTSGKRAAEVEAFACRIEQNLKVPVILWDERFSTVAANKALDRGNVKKKKKAALIDKVSAIIILQGYLDNRNESIFQSEHHAT